MTIHIRKTSDILKDPRPIDHKEIATLEELFAWMLTVNDSVIFSTGAAGNLHAEIYDDYRE